MNTSLPTSPPYSGEQRREAADWFVIIHAEEEPNAETLQAWLRWLDQCEGNRIAFETIAQAWHSIPAGAALSMPSHEELQSDGYEGDQSVDEWLEAGNRSDVSRHATAKRPRRRYTESKVAWLAAAALAVVAVGIAGRMHFTALHGSQSDVFTTRSGEQVEVTLADGSHVWLGPKSTLLVNFTADRRGLRLSEGEAYFAVRKDRARPFVVSSSGGDITAVGTAFNVRTVADHVTVSVSEGVVTVAPTESLAMPKAASLRVAFGQQLTFAAREPLEALVIVPSVAPGERARWRSGVLVYRDEPLRDVVTDVARYSGKQLTITDDAIGDLRYTGVVYQSAVDEWASALPESFPVDVVIKGNQEIISPR